MTLLEIVHPIDKQSIIIKDKEIKNIEETCYAYWKRGETCSNCISMRSYTEKDTFVKIEYADNKVILVTSTPIQCVYVSTGIGNKASQALYQSVGFIKTGEANKYVKQK